MRIVSLLFHDVYVREPGESGFSSPAADRYKLAVKAFDAQMAGLADMGMPVVAAGRAPSIPDGALPFLLTFDDGGASYYTVVADRLEARGWRGHCFVSTDFIGRRGFLTADHIRELDRRGHVIGSHSASHPPRFSACSESHMRREWSESRQTLEALLGHAITVASLPGGYFSRTVAETAGDAGISLLFTSNPSTRILAHRSPSLAGRFCLRPGCRDDESRRLVTPASSARTGAWIGWHGKGLCKPLLGPLYARVADWLCA